MRQTTTMATKKEEAIKRKKGKKIYKNFPSRRWTKGGWGRRKIQFLLYFYRDISGDNCELMMFTCNSFLFVLEWQITITLYYELICLWGYIYFLRT